MQAVAALDITSWLAAWHAGDAGAFDRVVPLVYDDLRSLAARQLSRERPDHTLQPTEIVHEAFLRFSRSAGLSFADRKHFFAVLGRLMRQILVDHARSRNRAKRGSGAEAVPLELCEPAASTAAAEVGALDEALERLATLDPLKAQIVELHFFVGLSVAETADALGCSAATVTRHWRMAKAWLYQQVSAA